MCGARAAAVGATEHNAIAATAMSRKEVMALMVEEYLVSWRGLGVGFPQ